MATKTRTIQYIKKEIEERGRCRVVRSVVEDILGQSYDDDDSFHNAVQGLVVSTAWLDSAVILWHCDEVLVSGSIVPPPPPNW